MKKPSQTNATKSGRGKRFFTYAILFLFVLTKSTWQNFNVFPGQAHSDWAVQGLLAAKILEDGTLFPEDWIFGMGEIFILSLSSFATIGLGLGLTVSESLALGGLIQELIFFGVGLALVTRLDNRLAFVVPGSLLFVLPLSPHMNEHLFGQHSWTHTIMFGLILAFLLARPSGDFVSPKRRTLELVTIFATSSMLLASNPAKAVLVFPPLFVAFWLSNKGNNGSRRRVLATLLFLVSGAVSGVLLHLLIRAVASVSSGRSSPRLLSLEKLPRSLEEFGLALGLILGPAERFEPNVFSIEGALQGLRILLAFAIVLITLFVWRFPMVAKQDFMSIVSISSLLVAAGVMTLTANTNPRYAMWAALMMCLITLRLVIDSNLIKSGLKLPSLITLIVVLGLQSTTADYQRPATPGNAPSMENINLLISAMNENGITRGVADFWIAGISTVESNQKVVLSPIRISGPGKLRFMEFHSSPSQYKYALENNTFVVIKSRDFNPEWEQFVAGSSVERLEACPPVFVCLLDSSQEVELEPID